MFQITLTETKTNISATSVECQSGSTEKGHIEMLKDVFDLTKVSHVAVGFRKIQKTSPHKTMIIFGVERLAGSIGPLLHKLIADRLDLLDMVIIEFPEDKTDIESRQEHVLKEFRIQLEFDETGRLIQVSEDSFKPAGNPVLLSAWFLGSLGYDLSEILPPFATAVGHEFVPELPTIKIDDYYVNVVLNRNADLIGAHEIVGYNYNVSIRPLPPMLAAELTKGSNESKRVKVIGAYHALDLWGLLDNATYGVKF